MHQALARVFACGDVVTQQQHLTGLAARPVPHRHHRDVHNLVTQLQARQGPRLTGGSHGIDDGDSGAKRIAGLRQVMTLDVTQGQ